MSQGRKVTFFYKDGDAIFSAFVDVDRDGNLRSWSMNAFQVDYSTGKPRVGPLREGVEIVSRSEYDTYQEGIAKILEENTVKHLAATEQIKGNRRDRKKRLEKFIADSPEMVELLEVLGV